MLRVLAATRSIHKQSPVFLSPYGTEPTFFFFMCRFLHSSLYFMLPVRAPAPTLVCLCTLQVWPGQTKMTIVKGSLEWLLLSAACRPRDGSSTCADDSLTLDRPWRHTIPPTVHLSAAERSTGSEKKKPQKDHETRLACACYNPRGWHKVSSAGRFSRADLGGAAGEYQPPAHTPDSRLSRRFC